MEDGEFEVVSWGSGGLVGREIWCGELLSEGLDGWPMVFKIVESSTAGGVASDDQGPRDEDGEEYDDDGAPAWGRVSGLAGGGWVTRGGHAECGTSVLG